MANPTEVAPGHAPDEHLSTEEIGALAEGAVSVRADGGMEEHLAGCEACSTLLAETIRLLEEDGASSRQLPSPVPAATVARLRRPFRVWLPLALAAGLAGLAALVWSQARSRDPLAPLLAATARERRTEARLTGGFRWAPLREVERGAEPAPEEDWGIVSAAAKAREAAERLTSPRAAAVRGTASLVAGRVDEAIELLEAARRDAPEDGRVLSDLSAAYLERSRRNGEAEDAARALDLIGRALRVEPSRPEALFNKALALERLGLAGDARDAWSAYMAKDPASGWAGEARRRRDALPPPQPVVPTPTAPVGAARGPASFDPRDLLGGHALQGWAAAVVVRSAGDVDAIAAQLGREAEKQSARSGDLEPREAVACLRDARRREKVARGALSMARARDLQAQDQRGEAGQAFHEAAALLEGPCEPLALRARLGEAIADYYRRGFAESPERFEALAVEAESREYRLLAARARWMQGLTQVGRGVYAQALSSYHLAKSHFGRLGDAAGAAGIDGLMAETLHLIGDEREEWKHRAAALAGMALVSPTRAHSLLSGAARSAREEARPFLAIALLEADEPVVANLPASMQAERWRLLAEALHEANDAPASRRAFEEARGAIDAIPDAALRDRVRAELAVSEARLEAEGGTLSTQNAAALDAAIAYFEGTLARFRLPDLLCMRARALRTHGDLARAREDTQRGLALLEEQLSTSGEDAATLAARAKPLVEEARRLAEGDAQLDVVERFRGRDLLRRLSQLDAASETPLRADTLRASLPERTEVLYYLVGGERLTSWRVTARGVRGHETNISARSLEHLVARYVGALRAREPETEELSRALHDLLLGGTEPGQPPDLLVIVPDGPLWGLPFATLLDRTTGRPLVERMAIAVAPSGSVFASGEARRRVRSGSGLLAALVLGDPALDGVLPKRPRLPGAAREAREVAALYSAPALLAREATCERFREESPRADVIHVAAHALTRTGRPELSRLLLSGCGGNGLCARDVASLDLRRARVVVLSGCGTAAGEALFGEGVLSLARAFRGAGAECVVASLWAVEDGSTRSLLVDFHRRLAAGQAAESALREAQRASMSGAGSPLETARSWGAFVLLA